MAAVAAPEAALEAAAEAVPEAADSAPGAAEGVEGARAAPGENVILWGGYSSIFQLQLQQGQITNNRYGSFHHDDLIGQPYGSKVRPKKGGQWVAMLRPTPELVTQSLAHRTQIIYHADISLILMLLDASPGKVMVEAGTGSGSLSASFVRALRPGGKLHTFEFHEERQALAAADFARQGFLDVVVSRHGDVCANGFPGAPSAGVHGVFLDLPSPWAAIPHADSLLVPGGKICTFSPCIEQIDRTACELRREGRYTDIKMFESLAVNWAVKEDPAAKKRRLEAGAEAAAPASWLSYQMPMRSHTSYIMVATRAPAPAAVEAP